MSVEMINPSTHAIMTSSWVSLSDPIEIVVPITGSVSIWLFIKLEQVIRLHRTPSQDSIFIEVITPSDQVSTYCLSIHYLSLTPVHARHTAIYPCRLTWPSTAWSADSGWTETGPRTPVFPVPPQSPVVPTPSHVPVTGWLLLGKCWTWAQMMECLLSFGE